VRHKPAATMALISPIWAFLNDSSIFCLLEKDWLGHFEFLGIYSNIAFFWRF
jgi:hypothetical protein